MYLLHGLGQYGDVVMILISRSSMKKLAMLGLIGNLLLLHEFIHKTYPGKEVGVPKSEFKQGNGMLCGHKCSLGEFCILLQCVLGNVNSWFSGTNVNSAFMSYEVMHSPSLGLIFLTCCTMSLMFEHGGEMVYNGSKNPNKFCGHPICDCTSAGEYVS